MGRNIYTSWATWYMWMEGHPSIIQSVSVRSGVHLSLYGIEEKAPIPEGYTCYSEIFADVTGYTYGLRYRARKT